MDILSHLPEHSRIWVYTSNREFTQSEIKEINSLGEEFVASWKVHGTPLQAGFELLYRRFLVVAVNETVAGASGCSIDGN